MRRLQRIAESPRDLPAGVAAAVIASRDFSASLAFLLPAAAAAIGAVNADTPDMQWVLLAFDAVLFLLGLRLVLRALLRSIPVLHRMRTGSLALGRITACRHVWQKKTADQPYEEFLPTWVTQAGASQVNKATGCLTTVVVALFVLPFLLIAAGGFVMLLMRAMGIGATPDPGDPSIRELLGWAALALAIVAASFVVVRVVKSLASGAARRGAPAPVASRHAPMDGHLSAGSAHAAGNGQPITLQSPLPTYAAGVDLICQAEYSVVGERHVGEGRLRLSDRIDLEGVELLLFSPSHRGRLVFLASLPPTVKIGARGEWEATSTTETTLKVAIVVAAAGIALLAWVPKLSALAALGSG